MKVALLMPPLYGVDMPPLGIAYIAGQLLKDGHDVRVFCLNSSLFFENQDKRCLWDWDSSAEWRSLERLEKHFHVPELLKRWAGQIADFSPALIGMSVNSHSKLLAELLTRQLRSLVKDVPVVFGGPLCSELGSLEECCPDVDVYVRGEGEEVISKIAEALNSGGNIRSLSLAGTIVNKGTAISGGEAFYDNGPGGTIKDLDRIPHPALGLFNFAHYTNKEELPILFSRGCDYNCKFCTDKPMWGAYRMRSPEDIVLEMRRHSVLFGRKKFKCNDLMVNGDPPALSRMAQIISGDNLGFSWGGMARARKDANIEQSREWQKGGCTYLTYGVESGSSAVLAHMGKPSPAVLAMSFKAAHEAGIRVNTLWMVGYLREGWAEFFQTMIFLARNRHWIDEFVSVSCCYIPRLSWIGRHSEELGITYDHNGDWRQGFRNSGRIRRWRRKMLLSFAGYLGRYKGGIS